MPALPLEHLEDRARLKRYIAREQLCSLMNDTKWRETMSLLQSIPNFHVRLRVKGVQEDTPPPAHWDGSFPWHLPTYESIEWLEIDPLVRRRRGMLIDDLVVDFTAQLTQVLRSIPVSFTFENGAIRIWGYTRRGCNFDASS